VATNGFSAVGGGTLLVWDQELGTPPPDLAEDVVGA
jgi:hypothetical protein